MVKPCETLTVRFKGGLGNQMFQYAFGRALAGDRTLLFDESDLNSDPIRDLDLGCFGLDLAMGRFPPLVDRLVSVPGMWRMIKLTRRSIRISGGQLIWDDMAGCDPRWASIQGTLFAVGYWQSAEYFRAIGPELREAFTPARSFSAETESLIDQGGEAIGVQVRRGDYLNKNVSHVHPAPSADYFSQAVKRIAERTGIRKAIVCTDDLEWARKHIDLPIEKVMFRRGTAQAWEDMSVLRACAHIVISNSSFGWWSAWLGSPERLVVCPRRWYGRGGRAFSSPAESQWIQI